MYPQNHAEYLHTAAPTDGLCARLPLTFKTDDTIGAESLPS
jgi:hypothetical protein